MLAHAQNKELLLRSAPVAQNKKYALLLVPERMINVSLALDTACTAVLTVVFL